MQDSKTNYYHIINTNIRNLRKKLKLSQEKFAETIGCSREYISRLENNKEQISLSLIFRISETYNIKPEKFFTNV
jgi:putative transcriptional regulator